MKVLQDIKATSKLLTVVISAIFVIPVYAGQITYPTDSYISGDTLTAADLNAKFNEIKTNVNQNEKSTVVVVSSATVNAGTSRSLRVLCPVSYPIAVSGGVSALNVLTYVVTSTAPVFDDGMGGQLSLQTTANGQYSGTTAVGWQGSVVNNSATNGTMKVAVICSN